MVDVKFIRKNPEVFKDILKKRNVAFDLERFLFLDERIQEIRRQLEHIWQKKNEFSKKREYVSKEEKEIMVEKLKMLSFDEDLLKEELPLIEKEYTDLLYRIPNILDVSVPIGKDESENVVESIWGVPKVFDFDWKAHYEIGEQKNWINMKKASEVSGSRFWYIQGDLVLLQFALIQYVIWLGMQKWFFPILPPVLVKEKAMFWTGFLPCWEDGVYRVNEHEENLYLVGTSEVSVTAYHMDEILQEDMLPLKYIAYSSCFRREWGSAGKDTRGIFRWHQFDKVEMVVFCKPSESSLLHEEMVAFEEEIWRNLEIPYRKVNICSGDLGNGAMKKYDLEAWIPSYGKYREVTSCSNMGEYQSRRLRIRYREKHTRETRYVHTLNGTVIALSRCMIAIIENNQTKEGNVMVPKVLIPYMGGKEFI